MLWANGGCSRWCPTPAAADSCFATKGGYSAFYVPFCEALLALRERCGRGWMCTEFPFVLLVRRVVEQTGTTHGVMAAHCSLADALASSVGEGWVYPLGRNIHALRLEWTLDKRVQTMSSGVHGGGSASGMGNVLLSCPRVDMLGRPACRC
ncbi:hypothetical protein DYB26_016209 [Aphanomyces astaci]|uniref:Uncharacterized protein n=1 Tax=Aphanomyces astaci TaxID=112090 RepID=A0A3R7BF11_APHAT|nr:hypothetical protein DYB26_016209 [Aphanomyces astaci]